MKWKMAENSLFAILMRQDWWVSALIALAVFGAVHTFMAWGYALFATTPFTVITLMVAWKQIRVPGGALLEKALEKVRSLSWENFAQALETGFKAEGYAVQRVDGAADFELEKSGRAALEGCAYGHGAIKGAGGRRREAQRSGMPVCGGGRVDRAGAGVCDEAGDEAGGGR
jgi:restriction system protein